MYHPPQHPPRTGSWVLFAFILVLLGGLTSAFAFASLFAAANGAPSNAFPLIRWAALRLAVRAADTARPTATAVQQATTLLSVGVLLAGSVLVAVGLAVGKAVQRRADAWLRRTRDW